MSGKSHRRRKKARRTRADADARSAPDRRDAADEPAGRKTLFDKLCGEPVLAAVVAGFFVLLNSHFNPPKPPVASLSPVLVITEGDDEDQEFGDSPNGPPGDDDAGERQLDWSSLDGLEQLGERERAALALGHCVYSGLVAKPRSELELIAECKDVSVERRSHTELSRAIVDALAAEAAGRRTMHVPRSDT